MGKVIVRCRCCFEVVIVLVVIEIEVFDWGLVNEW